MRKVRFAFDVLLYTSHADTNWAALVNSIRTNGKFVVVGFPEAHVKFDPLELVVHQSSITGSFTGNHDSMRRMLEFAQTHAIHPTIELLPMREVNHAIRSLKEEKLNIGLYCSIESVIVRVQIPKPRTLSPPVIPGFPEAREEDCRCA